MLWMWGNMEPSSDKSVKPSRYTVQVVSKALDVLNVLASKGSMSLAEICQQVEQPKSSVFRYLVTLEEHGYVQRSRHGDEYSLGLKLIELGRAVTKQFTVHEVALPFMRQLLDSFRETVNLAILESGKVVYLEILEGTHSIRMAARPGQNDFAHSTAIGKAILAYSPAAEVENVVKQHGLPALTSATITTYEGLLAELERVRTAGYSVDNIENEQGVRCVAAPILNHQNTPVAAISLSGPVDRIFGAKVELMGKELIQATHTISQQLGYRY
jgi:DNA-binding IclR family transcriptional regulator